VIVLEIIYEDEAVVAINKLPGVLVHPADNPQPDDIVAMKILRDQIGQHVFPIHRLDRPTSGVLLFAKSAETAKPLHLDFEEQRVTKTYQALVIGHPELDQWTCDSAIQKAEGKPYRDALTEFQVMHRWLYKGKPIALVSCFPKTGRFHQIRRHLLEAGHPIIGDYRYAGIETSDAYGKLLNTGDKMQLRAVQLDYVHPLSKKPLTIRVNSSLEDDFIHLVE